MSDHTFPPLDRYITLYRRRLIMKRIALSFLLSFLLASCILTLPPAQATPPDGGTGECFVFDLTSGGQFPQGHASYTVNDTLQALFVTTDAGTTRYDNPVPGTTYAGPVYQLVKCITYTPPGNTPDPTPTPEPTPEVPVPTPTPEPTPEPEPPAVPTYIAACGSVEILTTPGGWFYEGPIVTTELVPGHVLDLGDVIEHPSGATHVIVAPEDDCPVPATPDPEVPPTPEPNVPATPSLEPSPAEPECQEDDPCWDCETDGNEICGPVTTPTHPEPVNEPVPGEDVLAYTGNNARLLVPAGVLLGLTGVLLVMWGRIIKDTREP